MAKLLNGTLTVNYEKNSGTNYLLKIPLSQDDEFYSEYHNNPDEITDGLMEAPDIKNSPKSKILLVEDNIANLNIIEIFLHDLYEIDSTTTGEEAIIKSGITKYDLIIMDISLGSGLNGISTLKEIRKNKEYINIPVLAVTGFALSDDRDNIIRAGFNEYLAKPFTRKQLLYMVKKLL
jgi:CheY-like chemotaxis protein